MNCLGLASYGSDSGSEEDEPALVDDTKSAPQAAFESAAAKSEQSSIGIKRTIGSTTAFDGFGRSTVRRKARNALPLFSQPAALTDDSSDEDEERRRRAKVQSKSAKRGSLAFLPDPVNDIPVRDTIPTDFFTQLEQVAGPSDDADVPSATTTADLYRVNDDGQYMHQPVADAGRNDVQRAVNAEDLLTQAIQAEADKARKHHGRNVPVGLDIKEINAETLQQVAPHERAEMDAIRTALGSEYAQKVREETSGKNQPSRLAKRRHQITSLYQHAKMQELHDLEKKSQGAKSKAETAAKYGW